jgi:hypothetical protein
MRRVFAFALSFAVLFAGGWAGSAGAAAGPPARAGPVRAETGASIAIGDALEVSGQPLHVSVFYTGDAPEEVTLFYAHAFAARGVLPVLSAEKGLAHVSAFDRRDGLQRFVTALSQPSGETLVLTGIANPRRPPRFTRSAEGAGFPLPSGHRAYLGYRSSDASGAAESGQFLSALPPSEVLSFYGRELAARGWSQRSAGRGSSIVTFARGAEILSVATQALDARSGSAVFVNRTDGASR